MQACCEKRGALSAYCPYAATLVWVFLVVRLPPPPPKKSAQRCYCIHEDLF